jgi:hypothetical protein
MKRRRRVYKTTASKNGTNREDCLRLEINAFSLVRKTPRKIKPHPPAIFALSVIRRRSRLKVASITDAVEIEVGLIGIRDKSVIIRTIGNAIVVVIPITHIAGSIAVRIALIRIVLEPAVVGLIGHAVTVHIR